MKTDSFSNITSAVFLDRMQYTPSSFAKSALLYLQEVGSLQAIRPQVFAFDKEKQPSCLCLLTESGQGVLEQGKEQWELEAGTVAFLDCRREFSCRVSETDGEEKTPFRLRWCRFFGASAAILYKKYQECGGQVVFSPASAIRYVERMDRLRVLAESSDDIRDVRINQELGGLFTLLLEDACGGREEAVAKRMEIGRVKKYLDENYRERITLDGLEAHFDISKYYLTKLFKEAYGVTIMDYVIHRRIETAKGLLFTTRMAVEEVGAAVGMENTNYFCRVFKKLEAVTPGQYRQGKRPEGIAGSADGGRTAEYQEYGE